MTTVAGSRCSIHDRSAATLDVLANSSASKAMRVLEKEDRHLRNALMNQAVSLEIPEEISIFNRT